MRQFKHVVTLLLLVVVVGGLGANAVALAHTTPDSASFPARQDAGGDLAAFFPQDTLAYASFGTSGTDFEMLNMVLQRVQNAFPPDMLPPEDQITLGMVLDVVALELADDSFEAGIRPWLGDEIAVGVYAPDFLFDADWTNDDDMPLMVVASITDQEAAATFVEARIKASFQGDWTRAELEDGGTLFALDGWQYTGVVLVRSDVLVLTSALDFLPPAGETLDTNLMDNPYYAETLGLLPAEEYSGVVYVDTPMVLANAIGSEYNEEPAARFVATMILRTLAPMVVGFTMDGADTLVMDVVQPLGNITGLETLGITFDPLPIVDPEFLKNLPADAALVIQGTDLAQVFESSLGAAQTIVDQFLGPELLVEGELPPDALMLLNLMDIVVGNLTGFSYPRDLRPWLQGNYAIFTGVDSSFDVMSEPGAANFPIEWGAVFEVTDAEATRNFVRMLGRELQLALRVQGVQGVQLNTTQIDGVDIVTLDLFDYGTRLIQLAVAADDQLIVFGTRNAVDAVLFDQGPRFDLDLPELLPEASIVLYAGPPQLAPVVDWMASTGEAGYQEIEAARALLTVIERATISVQSTPDGGGILRATLTLGG